MIKEDPKVKILTFNQSYTEQRVILERLKKKQLPDG